MFTATLDYEMFTKNKKISNAFFFEEKCFKLNEKKMLFVTDCLFVVLISASCNSCICFIYRKSFYLFKYRNINLSDFASLLTACTVYDI